MTETDNKDVAKHLDIGTENNRKWLLRKLSELPDDERDTDKHFTSREIKPVVMIGTYDPVTKRFINDYRLSPMTFTTDATSAAATTWTVPAGKTWIVHAINCSNANRATGYTLSIGGTVRARSATTTITQSVSAALVGGGYFNVGFAGPLVVAAGTAILVTDLAFQAADVLLKTIVYTEVDAS